MSSPNTVLGHKTKVLVDGSSYPTVNGSLKFACDMHDVSDTESDDDKPRKIRIAGLGDCEVNIEAKAATDVTPTSGFGIRQNNTISPIVVYHQGVLNDPYELRDVAIEDFEPGWDVNQPNSFKLHGYSGDYDIPGESEA